MWISRKCTAMAVLCAGLAVAAATPSSAQSWGGAYGYAGGYGPYGYALNTDAGGCGGYGAYGSAPLYGFAGACRARRNHGHGGYVEACGIAPNDSMSRHVVSAKQAAYLDR